MNEKLTFKDGTEVTGHFYLVNDRLFMYMYNITLGDAFDILYNKPERTSKIICNNFGAITVASGYTRLVAVTDEGDDMISASLVK